MSRTPERIENIFRHRSGELGKVTDISREIHDRIENVDGFIEENSQEVCADCQQVCCIDKYSLYNCDDLVYIYSLGMKPQRCERRAAHEPCHFLTDDGCALDRTVRPSGCNWHFCDTLVQRMSEAPGTAYADFSESMEEIMGLWVDLIQEFRNKFREFTGQEMESAALVCASDITACRSTVERI